MEPTCTRALRRSLDERYELMIIKALAMGRNTEVSEEVYECVSDLAHASANHLMRAQATTRRWTNCGNDRRALAFDTCADAHLARE